MGFAVPGPVFPDPPRVDVPFRLSEPLREHRGRGRSAVATPQHTGDGWVIDTTYLKGISPRAYPTLQGTHGYTLYSHGEKDNSSELGGLIHPNWVLAVLAAGPYSAITALSFTSEMFVGRRFSLSRSPNQGAKDRSNRE